jgi:hypothetical protein
MARTDHEQLRRISVRVHLDDDKRVVNSMDHVVRGDAVSTC